MLAQSSSVDSPFSAFHSYSCYKVADSRPGISSIAKLASVQPLVCMVKVLRYR